MRQSLTIINSASDHIVEILVKLRTYVPRGSDGKPSDKSAMVSFGMFEKIWAIRSYSRPPVRDWEKYYESHPALDA